jgi:putative MATE family efflux protein
VTIMYNHSTTIQIIRLAIPVILGQITHTLLNFADRYFIAKLGVHEAAGAGLCVTLMWFLFTFTAIISGGTIALVSRKIGEQNEQEAVHSAEQSLLLSVIFGIIITLFSLVISGSVFSFFQAEHQVETLGLLYFRILLIGYPFVMTIITVAAIFQAAGDTKTPMKVFVWMSIANIVIDPFFIFTSFEIFGLQIQGFGLGIRGAGYATIIAEGFATLWLLVELYHFRTIRMNLLWRIRLEPNMIRRILRIGIWQGMNGLSRPLTAVVLQRILAFHGTNALAAFVFGYQWVSIIFLFFEGLRIAVATMVGRDLGKREYQQVSDTVSSGLILGSCLLMVFMVCGFLFPEQAIGIFIHNREVITIGVYYLKIVLMGLIFSVPMTVYSAAFNGAGDTRPPMIISFIANWAVKVGVASMTTYYLGLGVKSVWVAVSLSICVEGVGLYFWFRRGSWKTKMI